MQDKKTMRTLLCTTVGGVDPKEGTSAHIIRARGHAFRDTEISVSCPNTGLVNAEDSEVRGLDFRDVTLVRDG